MQRNDRGSRGEVLQTQCECVNQLKESIHELITSMQTNILNEMNEVQLTKSSVLSTRVTESEGDIAHLPLPVPTKVL